MDAEDRTSTSFFRRRPAVLTSRTSRSRRTGCRRAKLIKSSRKCSKTSSMCMSVGAAGWGPGGGSDDAAQQGRAPSACPPHRFVCSVVPCDSILKPSVGLVRNLLSKNKVNKTPRRNCPGPCHWSRLEEAGTSDDGYVQLVKKMVTVNSQRRRILCRV